MTERYSNRAHFADDNFVVCGGKINSMLHSKKIENAVPEFYSFASSLLFRVLRGFSRDIHYQMRHPLETNSILARKAGVSDADRVLDAGCGQGSSVFWLAKHYACQIDAITVSKGEFECVDEAVRSLNYRDKIRVFEENMLATHFSDNTFTIVWAVESLCHVDEKMAFLKEAMRIMAKGGRLVILDFFLTEELISPIDIRNYERFCEGMLFPSLTTKSEFLRMLEVAGFHNVQFDAYEQEIKSSIFDREISGWLGVIMSSPIALLRRTEGIFLKNSRASIAQGSLFRRKKLSYGVVYAEK